MKRKIAGLALVSALAVSVLAGCGSQETADTGSAAGSSTEESARDIEADRTTLIVGFDANYPPYGYMDDDGEYTGFDLELAQAVCDLEGWELTKQPINWDSKDMELNSGNIDCIWNGFTINGREDDYTWSEPYVDNSQVIVVKADSGITTFDDLAGAVVGVQKASAALDVLEGDQKELSDTFDKLEQFSDYNVAFTELEASSLDALAIDIGVAKYQIESRGSDKYVMLDETLNSEQYGVGFKLGNESLRDIINEDLEKLAEDGTVSELAEKYDIADMVILGK